MDDNAIRERLREAFRLFALPCTMPAPFPGLVLESVDVITLNGGRGRLCSACGELIPWTAEGSIEFKHHDGEVTTFHARCEQGKRNATGDHVGNSFRVGRARQVNQSPSGRVDAAQGRVFVRATFGTPVARDRDAQDRAQRGRDGAHPAVGPAR